MRHRRSNRMGDQQASGGSSGAAPGRTTLTAALARPAGHAQGTPPQGTLAAAGQSAAPAAPVAAQHGAAAPVGANSRGVPGMADDVLVQGALTLGPTEAELQLRREVETELTQRVPRLSLDQLEHLDSAGQRMLLAGHVPTIHSEALRTAVNDRIHSLNFQENMAIRDEAERRSHLTWITTPGDTAPPESGIEREDRIEAAERAIRRQRRQQHRIDNRMRASASGILGAVAAIGTHGNNSQEADAVVELGELGDQALMVAGGTAEARNNGRSAREAGLRETNLAQTPRIEREVPSNTVNVRDGAATPAAPGSRSRTIAIDPENPGNAPTSTRIPTTTPEGTAPPNISVEPQLREINEPLRPGSGPGGSQADPEHEILWDGPGPRLPGDRTAIPPATNVVTLEEANRLFAGIRNLTFRTTARRVNRTNTPDGRAPVPHNVPEEGCFDRAIMANQYLTQEGVHAEKIFAIPGRLSESETGFRIEGVGEFDWSYHVAPIIRVQNAQGEVVEMVLDHSLNSNRLLTVGEWMSELGIPRYERLSLEQIRQLRENAMIAGDLMVERPITYTANNTVVSPSDDPASVVRDRPIRAHEGSRRLMSLFAANGMMRTLADSLRENMGNAQSILRLLNEATPQTLELIRDRQPEFVRQVALSVPADQRSAVIDAISGVRGS